MHIPVMCVCVSAAGDGLTNIMENHTFVPRARYLRLLRRRRRYQLLYHSVLRLCSEFRESRSFLWLNIKKSIHGKSSRIKKCGEIRHVPDCLVYILEYPDFGRQENQSTTRPSERPPVMGEKMSKRLGGIKGCKYKSLHGI